MSLSRRLAAVLEAAERHNPQAVCVHRMKPAVRLRYDNWQTRCERLTDELGGGAALYERYIESGTWPLPDPPVAVAQALGVDRGLPVIDDGMGLGELSEIYARMISD